MRRIAALAARQHGVIARRQLLELGLGRRAIEYWVSTCRLHRLYPGVFAYGHKRITVRGRWMAAVLACGPGALLSHTSAGALRELMEIPAGPIHVTVPSRGRRPIPGIAVHQAREIHPADGTIVDAIPVTSVPRTLLDLAETLPERRLLYVLEQSERVGLFDLKAIEATIARSPGRHGLRPLRALLSELTGDPPDIRSKLERDFRELCRDFGLPTPSFNVVVEGHTVDAHFPGTKLVVELDGYGFHRHRRAFEDDRERDAVLQLAGFSVLRLTDRSMNEDRAAAAEKVWGMLRR